VKSEDVHEHPLKRVEHKAALIIVPATNSIIGSVILFAILGDGREKIVLDE
jgi:hypothetical protein